MEKTLTYVPGTVSEKLVGVQDSNLRHPPCKDGALPTALSP
jgi:hypothetical protein